METLNPKMAQGLAEVPSLRTAAVGIAFDFVGAFFLSSGGGIGPFLLAFIAYLPFLEGEMLGISSYFRFSSMTILFAARVVLLGSPFAIWASFFRLIFFDIAT